MRRLFIPFYVFFLFFVIPKSSFATHVIGGDLTYECTGPDEYLVTLRVYRGCDGSPSMTETLNLSSASCGVPSLTQDSVLSLTLSSNTDVSQNCPAQLDECVEEHIYTRLITLPPGCDDWKLSYYTCCRDDAITTGSSGNGLYITAQLDNTYTPCNSSPAFSSPGRIFVCDDSPISYSQGTNEVDGDSLVYSLTNCMDTVGLSVDYISGLSGLNPLSTISGVSIDSETGEINFTPTPGMTQSGPICVRVEEYRNGVKIGEVVRDIQININILTVPTMSQWGLILLFIILSIIGVVFIRQGEKKAKSPFI